MEIDDEGAYISNLWAIIKKYNPFAAKELRHQTLVSAMQAGTRNEDAHVAVFSYDIAARFPALKCRTLLLSSSNDVFFSVLEETGKLIPNCHTAVVADADAMVLMEKPEAVAALVQAHIQG